MSGVLDVLQIKEKAVLTLPASGARLGGTSLASQTEQEIYEVKW